MEQASGLSSLLPARGQAPAITLPLPAFQRSLILMQALCGVLSDPVLFNTLSGIFVVPERVEGSHRKQIRAVRLTSRHLQYPPNRSLRSVHTELASYGEVSRDEPVSPTLEPCAVGIPTSQTFGLKVESPYDS